MPQETAAGAAWSAEHGRGRLMAGVGLWRAEQFAVGGEQGRQVHRDLLLVDGQRVTRFACSPGTQGFQNLPVTLRGRVVGKEQSRMNRAQPVRVQVGDAEVPNVAGHQEPSMRVDRGRKDGLILRVGVDQVRGVVAPRPRPAD